MFYYDEAKIVVRTLLYGPLDHGQYVQNMFIRLCIAEADENFNIWASGDNGIARGGGLFVSKTGVSVYHHFLLPRNEDWNFVAEDYFLEVFAETMDSSPRKIFDLKLSLNLTDNKVK